MEKNKIKDINSIKENFKKLLRDDPKFGTISIFDFFLSQYTELAREAMGNDREKIDYVMDVKNLYPGMENESRHYAEGVINGYNQAKAEIREELKKRGLKE
jgi:hypothetical protein